MCGKQIKHLGNGFTMLKMILNLRNGLYVWEITYVCGNLLKIFDKRLKYVGNDVDLWEMAQICGEMA